MRRIRGVAATYGLLLRLAGSRRAGVVESSLAAGSDRRASRRQAVPGRAVGRKESWGPAKCSGLEEYVQAEGGGVFRRAPPAALRRLRLDARAMTARPSVLTKARSAGRPRARSAGCIKGAAAGYLAAPLLIVPFGVGEHLPVQRWCCCQRSVTRRSSRSWNSGFCDRCRSASRSAAPHQRAAGHRRRSAQNTKTPARTT